MEFVVIPELAVRQQYDQLPTGPDECPRIQELELEAARLTEVALDLDGRSPPRPTPSRYSALREDSVRFIEGVAGVDKVVQLLGQLSNGDRSGVAQAEVLRANALSWAENLAHRYPKYRDLYQPLQLAAYEMCHGLALSIGASEMHASLNRSQAIVPIANHLMAFPKPQFGTAAELSLSSTQVQQAAASVAAQLARDKLSSKVADPASLTKIANEAALMTRLKLLQCALHEIARKANSHTGKTTAFDRLHSVSGSLLDVWESIKEEEERRAAEEFELFKSKARTTEVLSEEQVRFVFAIFSFNLKLSSFQILLTIFIHEFLFNLCRKLKEIITSNSPTALNRLPTSLSTKTAQKQTNRLQQQTSMPLH